MWAPTGEHRRGLADMCGRFIQYSDPEVYAERLYLELEPVPAAAAGPRYNLAPTQQALVARIDPRGQRLLSPMRWGLVPHWSKDPRPRYQMINARAESLAERPAYRAAFRERRCLVPTEGFYEWRTQGRVKQPFLIRRADREPFLMAGLWEAWWAPETARDGPPDITSFTIVVTSANTLIQPIHDRMPLIVDRQDLDRWLDPDPIAPEDLPRLAAPVAPNGWVTEPVSTRVNSPRNDDPGLIEALGDPACPAAPG